MTEQQASPVPDEELFDDDGDEENEATEIEVSAPDPELDRENDDTADTEEPEPRQEPEQEARAEDEDRVTPHVQQRINQLTARFHDADRARQAAEAETRRLRQELSTQRTQGLDQTITTLEGQAESLRAELRTAKENGDTDRELEVQDKLDETRAALRDARTQKEKAPQPRPDQQGQQAQAPARRPVTREQALAEMPAQARTWAEDKAWLFDPGNPLYRNTVMGIAGNMVEQEGLSDADPAFFAELDRRVAAAFPHLYPRQEPAPRPTPPRRQAGGGTVAGPSRAPDTGSKRTLTPEDKANMARFGLDPRNKAHLAEYARNKT